MKHSLSRLKDLLDFDPLTGFFVWVRRGDVQWDGRFAGKRAGRVAWNGYRLITVEYVCYREHHLAWLWKSGVWPEVDIDHINGKRDDNRLMNLRSATRSENLANKWDESRNTSGFKGVSFSGRKAKPWAAHIKKGGKSKFLGRYSTPEEAHAAYVEKARELFGQFAKVA